MTDNLISITSRVTSLEASILKPTEANANSFSNLLKLNSDKIKKLSERQDLNDRKLNLIIRGLDVSMGYGLSSVVSEIFHFLGYSLNNWSAHRINNSNLVRVIFNSAPERLHVLKNAKNLRNLHIYSQIFINPDYTYEQRIYNKELRAKLKDIRNHQQPKAFIQNNKIVIADGSGNIVPIETLTNEISQASYAQVTSLDTPSLQHTYCAWLLSLS